MAVPERSVSVCTATSAMSTNACAPAFARPQRVVPQLLRARPNSPALAPYDHDGVPAVFGRFSPVSGPYPRAGRPLQSPTASYLSHRRLRRVPRPRIRHAHRGMWHLRQHRAIRYHCTRPDPHEERGRRPGFLHLSFLLRGGDRAAVRVTHRLRYTPSPLRSRRRNPPSKSEMQATSSALGSTSEASRFARRRSRRETFRFTDTESCLTSHRWGASGAVSTYRSPLVTSSSSEPAAESTRRYPDSSASRTARLHSCPPSPSARARAPGRTPGGTAGGPRSGTTMCCSHEQQ